MRSVLRLYLLVLLMLGSSVGCTAPRVVQPPEPSGVSPPAPPEEKLAELVIDQIEDKPRPPPQRFDFTLRKADLRGLLLEFAKATHLNFVFGPEIAGEVTAELKQLTLDEALEAILRPLNLTFRREGVLIRVLRRQVETRVFHLNYVGTVRSGSARIATAGARLSGSASSVGSDDKADLFGDVEAGIKVLLSADGRVAVNKFVDTIVVTDFPEHLQRVADYIQQIASTAQRQVLIEATIAEVTLSNELQFGINWNVVANVASLSGTFSQTLSPGGGLFQVGVSREKVAVLLNALAHQGRLNLVSSPKISTLNNQRALIRVGREDVFFSVTRTPPRVIGESETIISTPQVILLGLTLSVTPQVGEDGFITMSILPSLAERSGEATSRSGDVVPIVDVRETETVVRVRNGETIVIAGLIQKRENDNIDAVPVLGDLPLVGPLFRRIKRTGDKTELAIFLTPTIMTGRKIPDFVRERQQGLEKAREENRRDTLFPVRGREP